MARTRSTLLHVSLAGAALLLAACGGTGGQAAQETTLAATSDTAPAVRAAQAYWDLAGGGSIDDLPEGVALTVNPVAGWYRNGSDPRLQVEYLPGWTPYTVPVVAGAGVVLQRDDASALWRRVRMAVPPATPARQLRESEVENLLWALRLDGPVEVLEIAESATEPTPGVTRTTSRVFARIGGHTAQIIAVVTHYGDAARAVADIEVAAAPAGDYDDLAARQFIPTHVRLRESGLYSGL